jgi:hypothetical protein
MPDFITTFFNEKQLDERTYEVPGPGGTLNMIDSDVVIDHIKLTRGEERKQIEGILRRIDFMNGDVHHFLRHLAQALAFDI